MNLNFLKKIASLRCYILKNICVTNLDFWEIINLRRYFKIHENWEFQIFNNLKKKLAKKTFFKFLNPFYFPLGYGAKLILGTFWDILVHLLKNVIPQLWVSYHWSYNHLKSAGRLKFKGRETEIGLFSVDVN